MEIQPPTTARAAGKRVAEATVVVAAVLLFPVLDEFLPRGLPALTVVPLVWGALVAVTLASRSPYALHVAVLGGLAATIGAGLPREIAGLVPLGAALGIYGLIVQATPELRATASWVRVGSLDRTGLALVSTVVLGSVVGLALWTVVSPEAFREASQGARELIADMSLWLVVPAGLAFSLANAAAEEAVYRGVFMESLLRVVPPSAALVVQAVSFALLHLHGFPRGAAGVALAGVYGLLLGLIRLRSRGLLAPWIAHVGADVAIGSIVLGSQ